MFVVITEVTPIYILVSHLIFCGLFVYCQNKDFDLKKPNSDLYIYIFLLDKLRRKLNELGPKVKEEIQPIPVIPEMNVDPLSTLDPFWASKK